MDEELAYQLQEEEVAMEEMHQGWDLATSELIAEAIGLLIKRKALMGALHRQARLSWQLGQARHLWLRRVSSLQEGLGMCLDTSIPPA